MENGTLTGFLPSQVNSTRDNRASRRFRGLSLLSVAELWPIGLHADMQTAQKQTLPKRDLCEEWEIPIF